MGWNKNKPGNSDKISLSAATIRGNFKAIEDDTLTIPMKGIRLKKQTSNPTPVATNGFIYTKEVVVGADTDTELYYEDADGSVSKMTRKGRLNPFGIGIIGFARFTASVSAYTLVTNSSFNLAASTDSNGSLAITFIDQPASTAYVVIPTIEDQTLIAQSGYAQYDSISTSGFRIKTYSYQDLPNRFGFSVVVLSSNSANN